MGNVLLALIVAYTFAAVGLLMGYSELAVLGVVTTVGTVVTLALGLRMTWTL